MAESNMTQYQFSQQTKQQMLISVVVPAYNLEKPLERCLNSIITQDYTNLEIVVLDNGSQDKTWDVIQNFEKKDNRIKGIHIDINCKPSGARNIALKIVRGYYIHFCDGDDALPLYAYSSMINASNKGHSHLVIGNYMRMYPNDNNLVKDFSHYTSTSGLGRCTESSNTTLWNKLFLRDIIVSNNLRFDETMRYSEDLLFYYQYLNCIQNATYTDNNVYIYTDPIDHEDSDNSIKTIRYGNVNCIIDTLHVYVLFFKQNNLNKIINWSQLIFDQFKWTYNFAFQLIQDNQEKENAYQILKNSLLMLKNENPILFGWNDSVSDSRFKSIFHIDYPLFQLLNYHEYCFCLSLLKNNISNSITIYDKYLPCCDVNDVVHAKAINTALEGLDSLILHINNCHYYRKLYWNTWFDIWKNHWMLLYSLNLKEEYWNKLVPILINNGNSSIIGNFNNSYAIQKIQDIWETSVVMLQELSFKEYLLSYALHVGSPISIAKTFITATRHGQTRMLDILAAVKSWLLYKISLMRG